MRSLIALSFVLVCFVDKSYGTFADFMNNLPSEIANAFSTAWASITDAIKKPVRLKRLGPGGKQKTTITSEATTVTEKYPTEPSDVKATSSGNRLTLPLLPVPKFKSLDEWRNMQKAHYAAKRKGQSRGPVLVIVDDNLDVKPQRSQGDSFATMMYL